MKREVLHPALKDSQADRHETAIRMISMLGVNFAGEQDKNLAVAEFGTFLRGFSLSKEEVIEAYQMALRKELSDLKGQVINVYPNLSVIQAGEILTAYDRFKKSNASYLSGKQSLKEKKEPVVDKEKIRQEFLEMVFGELIESGYCDSGWLLYAELEKKIAATDKEKIDAYNAAKKVYLADAAFERENGFFKKAISAIRENASGQKFLTVPMNMAKSDLVSSYLKPFAKKGWSDFKSAIDG